MVKKIIHICRGTDERVYNIVINKKGLKQTSELNRFINDIMGMIKYKTSQLMLTYNIPDNNFDDLIQDLLMAVLKALPKIKDDCKDAKYYLYKTMENTIKNKVLYKIGRDRLGMMCDYEIIEALNMGGEIDDIE